MCYSQALIVVVTWRCRLKRIMTSHSLKSQHVLLPSYYCDVFMVQMSMKLWLELASSMTAELAETDLFSNFHWQ